MGRLVTTEAVGDTAHANGTRIGLHAVRLPTLTRELRDKPPV